MAQVSSTLRNGGEDCDAVMKQMAVLRDDVAKVAQSVQSTASARRIAIAMAWIFTVGTGLLLASAMLALSASIGPIAATGVAGCTALLHKSAGGRSFPIPGQTYPVTSVMGVPRAVKPLSTATLTWNSAT
jgi:hypothetical protein